MKIKFLLLILFIASLITVSDKSGSLLLNSDSFASKRSKMRSKEGEYCSSSCLDRDQDLFFTIMLKHLRRHLIFISKSELKTIISSVLDCSDRYGMTPELIFSLIHTESSFNSKAISKKGAIGLMQIMPITAESIAKELHIEWSGKEMLYDPVINIELGTYYLHHLFNSFKDMDIALSAYNIGPTKVFKAINRGSFFKSRFSLMVKRRSEELARLAYTKSS